MMHGQQNIKNHTHDNHTASNRVKELKGKQLFVPQSY